MDYGTKIAIGAGAGIGVMAFVCVAAFIFLRRSKTTGSRRNGADPSSSTATDTSEAEWRKAELGGQVLCELDAGRGPVEIDSKTIAAEVNGDCTLCEADQEVGVVEVERKSNEVMYRAEIDDGTKIKDEENVKYVI